MEGVTETCKALISQPWHDIWKIHSMSEGNAEITHEPDSTVLHGTHATKPLLTQNCKDSYLEVPQMQSQGGVSTSLSI